MGGLEEAPCHFRLVAATNQDLPEMVAQGLFREDLLFRLQGVSIELPPLAGQFASLIKDSSLLSIISVSEFTLNAQEVNAFTFSTLESYLPLAAGYLLLTLPISLWSKRLEEKYRYAT